MFAKDHHLVVCDVETTGRDAATDLLLEVALLVVDKNLGVVDRFHSLVTEAASFESVENHLEPGAREMHEESGLLRELREEYEKPYRTTAPAEVEVRALEFLARAGAQPGRIMWIGYSVQFDKSVIARALPLVDWVSTYQILEIGSPRQVFNLGGFELKKRKVDGRPHRALDDAESSLEELRSLRDLARVSYRFSAGAP